MPKNKLPFFVTEKSKCFRGGTIAANNWSFILPQECIFKQKQVRSSWFVLYKLLSWYIFFFSFQLKKELEAFDPAFFEEIEDLKYNYQKSVERNVLYERQLRQLSRQFGVDVNIPTED